ncbi:MAG: hypothetical protein LBV72_10615 [Tannerella sp.]|nr:hypothetical protein [Tannerella sp.]
MKRLRFFLSISVFMMIVFTACSDKETDVLEPEKPVVPEKPTDPDPDPAPVKYGRVMIDTRSSFRTNTDTFDLRRICEIELFDCTDIEIEKRTEDAFGIAYDKTNKRKINALGKVVESDLYSDSVVIGKSYYIHIKALKGTDIEYPNNGALSDTIITIAESDTTLRLTKIFSLRAESNQYEPWLYPNKALPKPDFGVAIWGDTKEYIEFNELKTRVSGGSNNLMIYDYNGKWYSYYLDDNNKFFKGSIDYSVQFDPPNSEFIKLPIYEFQSTLKELEKNFGEPISKTKDVFSFNMDDNNFGDGYAFSEAQSIMVGGTPIEYRFQNEQVDVICTLSYYLRSGKYRMYGFTIVTDYIKR